MEVRALGMYFFPGRCVGWAALGVRASPWEMQDTSGVVESEIRLK